MLTMPEDVDSRRESSLSVPAMGGSVQGVLHRKANTVLPWLARGLSLPVEGVIGFSDGAVVCQTGLLKSGNVDVQASKFSVDDSGLPCVVYLLEVCR